MGARVGKKRKLDGPTLEESKAVIIVAATVVLLFASFTYYMGFVFEYPTNVLVRPPFGSSKARRNRQATPDEPGAKASDLPLLKLTSTEFTDGGPIPTKFTCAAGSGAVSPPLQWSDAPDNTASFVVIVHDAEPDSGKNLTDVIHWVVWDIPATANQLPEGVSHQRANLPDGSYQTNADAGQGGNFGYRPPCLLQHVPTPRHCAFDLFAMDQKLNVPSGASPARVLKTMDGHMLGHAVLIGLLRQ